MMRGRLAQVICARFEIDHEMISLASKARLEHKVTRLVLQVAP